MFRLREGDILGKSLMEKLQVLFVGKNLQLGVFRVNEMLDVKCQALNLAPVAVLLTLPYKLLGKVSALISLLGVIQPSTHMN